jgi:hypothetical protein
MSDDLLLPIYKRSTDNVIHTHTSFINKWKLIEIILFHISFIIGDIYFSIFNCGSPNVIINVSAYFGLYASMELIWTIYVIKLIINQENIALSFNCDAYTFIIYHLFVISWNMLGAFLLSDLLNYSCEQELYNYLFAKIIINYFYCFYKIMLICHEL